MDCVPMQRASAVIQVDDDDEKCGANGSGLLAGESRLNQNCNER